MAVGSGNVCTIYDAKTQRRMVAIDTGGMVCRIFHPSIKIFAYWVAFKNEDFTLLSQYEGKGRV